MSSNLGKNKQGPTAILALIHSVSLQVSSCLKESVAVSLSQDRAGEGGDDQDVKRLLDSSSVSNY